MKTCFIYEKLVTLHHLSNQVVERDTGAAIG